MRAAVCNTHGAPDVVRVEERESPALSAGQIRVRVGAAAVNFPDVLIVANEYQVKIPAPFVPGSEFAGSVIEVGESVDTLAVGDRVAGTGIVGAFAEEAVAAANSVWRIPEGIDAADVWFCGAGLHHHANQRASEHYLAVRSYQSSPSQLVGRTSVHDHDVCCFAPPKSRRNRLWRVTHRWTARCNEMIAAGALECRAQFGIDPVKSSRDHDMQVGAGCRARNQQSDKRQRPPSHRSSLHEASTRPRDSRYGHARGKPYP